MSDVRAAFYGDDITGSVDALLQFAREGWRGRLFVGVPGSDALATATDDCDVIGIAGIARSLRTDDLEAEVRPALVALLALDPAIIQYKACSTADSSPQIGSLGRVLEIGRDVVGEHSVPMLFAQPDFGRYTVFGHHFASEGGAVYRLDRQPTMSTHPSTPMTESDLALHLSRQTRLPIGAFHVTGYNSAAAIAARLGGDDDAAVVLDAVDDGHLRMVGDALVALPRPVFAIGSGGLSRAIAMAAGSGTVALPTATPARGPVIAVSGSLSPQTRRQMDAAARAGWHVGELPLDASGRAERITDVIADLAAGRSVALTAADAAADEHADLLGAIAESAATIVRAVAVKGAASRVIICGGDTSGRVASLLGTTSLTIAANPWDNVVLLRAHATAPGIDGLELILKGGQVGSDDLFERVRELGLIPIPRRPA
ncbi:four-carbon acid sugar kinase family protein [Microbacterium deminutum]|uniref:Four-carbon acid sugar kinase family protein n=1 Tax=Microbacterium deminutum TaxID=344164 RepID=A0ABN2QS51_9MICO